MAAPDFVRTYRLFGDVEKPIHQSATPTVPFAQGGQSDAGKPPLCKGRCHSFSCDGGIVKDVILFPAVQYHGQELHIFP